MEKDPFEGKLWLVIITVLAMIIFFATLKTLIGGDIIDEIAEEIEPAKGDTAAPSSPAKPVSSKPNAKPDAEVTRDPSSPDEEPGDGKGKNDDGNSDVGAE